MVGKVAVILVNYNGKKYLEDCLKSIQCQTYSNIEIVVVDNHSTDDSVAYIQKMYQGIVVLPMNENLGFGEGCNIGAEYALKRGSEYILLLNTDTIIEEDLISMLVSYADDRTVVTPRMYTFDERGNQLDWYAGGHLDLDSGLVNQLCYSQSSINNAIAPRTVDFVTGCCLLIHESIWRKIGGFEKKYFLYYEDVDFSVKLQRNKISMLYVPQIGLWHRVGGSSDGDVSCLSQYYGTRNRLFFIARNQDVMRCSVTDVMKQILRERGYLKPNAVYNQYVQAALMDYMEGFSGTGYYGRMLLQDNCYFKRDYEIFGSEIDSHIYSLLRKNPSSLILANPRKVKRIFELFFDVELVNPFITAELRLYIGDGMEKYTVPGRIETSVMMEAEEIKMIDLKISEDDMKDAAIQLPEDIQIALEKYIARVQNFKLQKR